MTIRETIIEAVRVRLAAIPGLAFVELMSAVAPSDYPALSIDDFGQTKVETDATHSTFTLNLGLEGFVQAATGSLAHAQINALYADAVRALLAAPDRLGEVAGGVVQSIEEGALSIAAADLAATRTLSFTLAFDIQFINRSHDPSLA